MIPAFARAQTTASARRLHCWYVPCGIYMKKWTPATIGADFELPPILAPLARTDGPGIRNGISVDQVVAQAIGRATSLPSLQLGADGGGSVGNCASRSGPTTAARSTST